jgi:prevent-host-death family protein
MEISILELRAKLAEAINRVAYQGERAVLTRHRKGVAALVSMEDLALLEKLEDEADIKAARAALREGGKPIPWERVKAELGLRGQGKGGMANNGRARRSSKSRG